MKNGIESLKAAVQKDAKTGCFNENGCDHEFTRMMPETNPRLIEMGFTQKCVAVSKCMHKYCDKYKWVLDRAKVYAEKTDRTAEEIISIWESNRTYWYMNYYQDNQQPLNGRPKSDLIKHLQDADVLRKDLDTYEFLVTTLNQEHQMTAKAELAAKVEALKSNLQKKLDFIALLEISCFGASGQTGT